MTTENFCFYLQNRLVQTSQIGDQWYSDTSHFSIPCIKYPFAAIPGKQLNKFLKHILTIF
jgi:hypothetical protein